MKLFYLLIICLSFLASARCQSAPPDENRAKLEKIFANKRDVDFEFYMGGGRNSSLKYFLRNDSLWFAGTNLYTTVIPLSNIDFERKTYFLESSLWKTKANEKCIEVPLYAVKGKLFEKEYEIEVFKQTDEGTIDMTNLILPDKAFAEAFIKYLKEHRP
ncbi:MAG: hypothetical protein IPI66_12285 [Chitinophagaceae bacterium]|nr:hypothetical protein [Chitinophagaceae bacterium]MBL0056341.1 hypothetical protein [Chitinophagaceae bacterium]